MQARASTLPSGSGEVLSDAHHAPRHQEGSAWTDRGTVRLVSGGSGDWAAAVRCQRRAIELLGELPVGENISYLADLGAAWVNLGCALKAGASSDCLSQALGAFDRAIELLERLPMGDSPRFRHNLAAAWMNRADVWAQIDTADGRVEALRGYGRAIGIARELPLDEKPSFRVLLASCWINLGSLHQRSSGLPEAVRAYDGALAALGTLPQGGHRLACHHAATALTNRGEALLQMEATDSAERAVDCARRALTYVEGRDLDGPAEAKLSLRALRVMARGLESLARGSGSARIGERVAALTDVAERGIGLAFGSREAAPEVFDPFIVWFYSFGSRIYGRYQPQFLAEYLQEVIDRCRSGAGSKLLEDLRTVAGQAAAGALEELYRNRLIIDGTRQTQLLLHTARELRIAAEHYNP